MSRILFYPCVYLFVIIRLRDKPPVYKDAESDSEREVAKRPHNARSKRDPAMQRSRPK